MNGNTVRRSILDGLSFTLLFLTGLNLMVEPTTEQLLNLPLITILFFSGLLAGGLLSYILNKNGIKTLGQNLFESDVAKTQVVMKAFYKNFWCWQLIVVLMVLITVGILKTQFSIRQLLDEDGFAGARRLFAGLLTPNWSVLSAAIQNMVCAKRERGST